MTKLTKSPLKALSRRSFLATSLGGAAAIGLLPGIMTNRAMADVAPELLEAAKAEGTVTFYSVVPATVAEPFVKRFEELYGIRVDYQRLTSGPLGQRYASEAEGGAVVADAIAMTDYFFMETASEKGWLAKVDDLGVGADYPEQFRSEHYYSVQLLPHGLCYNTAQIAEAPTSWEVLLDPAYKGRLALLDPRNGFYTSVWYYALREKHGADFLTKLAQQEITFIQSASQGVQQVAAGASAICAPAYPNLMPELEGQGAPIALAMPDPTVASAVFAAASEKAPHPNAARVLIAFLLSEEGQSLYNANNVSPLGELPGTLPLPALTDVDLKAVQEAQPEIFAALGVS